MRENLFVDMKWGQWYVFSIDSNRRIRQLRLATREDMDTLPTGDHTKFAQQLETRPLSAIENSLSSKTRKPSHKRKLGFIPIMGITMAALAVLIFGINMLTSMFSHTNTEPIYTVAWATAFDCRGTNGNLYAITFKQDYVSRQTSITIMARLRYTNQTKGLIISVDHSLFTIKPGDTTSGGCINKLGTNEVIVRLGDFRIPLDIDINGNPRIITDQNVDAVHYP